MHEVQEIWLCVVSTRNIWLCVSPSSLYGYDCDLTITFAEIKAIEEGKPTKRY